MSATEKHGKAIEEAGYFVAVAPRDLKDPATESCRFFAMVASASGRQVAVYRCSREGEFCGWGWVEHPDRNGRTEYRTWTALLAALERHPAGRADG